MAFQSVLDGSHFLPVWRLLCLQSLNYRSQDKMPPKRDRRKLGARPYKNYSDEMLSLAVDMIHSKKITSYDAEKMYGIPRRTVERKVKNMNMNKPGAPQRLTEQEELDFVKVLIVVADFGAPLNLMDLRILVHEYLMKNNKAFIFDGKPPGEWWARAFIERHRDKLTTRLVQNIKRARAEKTLSEFQNYFNNLEHVVKNVPPTHLLNYDETNFSDNPGTAKCIFRRGVKYPERILNSTKGCISVMFGGTANGKVMPPYVVYKSDGLWSQWVEGGPDDARYNRTKSGWFDSSTFFDWFSSIIVPWARKLEGTKVIIGDNLSSHINLEVIELCEKYNIKFVLLPSNSTQLTQPLDVAFFGPLKKTWRKILTNYKIENPRQASLNKCHFPPLLKKVMDNINMGKKENVVSGFRATGIYPFNPHRVLKKVPEYNDNKPEYTVDQALLDYLKKTRKPNEMKRGRNKKLNVESGMSISKSDLPKKEATENQNKRKENRKEKTNQNTNKKRKIDTEVKIHEFTGLQSIITVNVSPNLSDIEDPDDRTKENYKATSNGDNKTIKRIKKTLTKKEKKKPIDSGSTTTEDIEMSLHSDSDIVDIDSEDMGYYYEQFNSNSPEIIDLVDDTDVARRVDMIEKEIFESIPKKDQEDEGDKENILNEYAIDGEEHMNREDKYSRFGNDISKQPQEINNNLNKNEYTWDLKKRERESETNKTMNIKKKITTKRGKLEIDVDIEKIENFTELQSTTTGIHKLNIKPNQNTTNKRKLETEVKIDELTGLHSNITVEVCGNLSDIEDQNDRYKDNEECTSTGDNKTCKLKKKALNKKEKKVPIKITGLNDDTEVAKNVNIIEKVKIERIEKIDEGDTKREDCYMNNSKLNENPNYDEKHMNKKRNEKEIKIQSNDSNNNLNKNECSWNIGDTILTRYYCARKWTYYIGIIENVNNAEKVYSVSYYKTIQLGDYVKFVKPKRVDKDSSLPENCLVKSINLLQISENPVEYSLLDDDDEVFFK